MELYIWQREKIWNNWENDEEDGEKGEKRGRGGGEGEGRKVTEHSDYVSI